MADIGVIGGSGFYTFLSDAQTIEIDTPFGPPSEAPVVGDLDGREVAFIPRHGADHRFPPHRIPYRANLWALRQMGVRQILAPCAVGGTCQPTGDARLCTSDGDCAPPLRCLVSGSCADNSARVCQATAARDLGMTSD